MLRITIELLPGGDDSAPQHLGTGYITNDGKGTQGSGNYDCSFSKWRSAEVWRRGRVVGFPRKTRGPWDLLYRALRNAVGGRNL